LEGELQWCFVFGLLLEADGAHLPLFVEGDAARRFLGVEACDLYANGQLCDGVKEKIEKLKGRMCEYGLVKWSLKGEARYKLVSTTIL